MKTNFDDISDDEIEKEIEAAFPLANEYDNKASHLRRIARLAASIGYWKSWLGPPATYYESEGVNYDGHHRCRAVKFLARQRGLQIHIPVRYSTDIKEPKL